MNKKAKISFILLLSSFIISKFIPIIGTALLIVTPIFAYKSLREIKITKEKGKILAFISFWIPLLIFIGIIIFLLIPILSA